MHLNLRRGHKEDCVKMGESKVGNTLWLDYRIVNKTLHSMWSGLPGVLLLAFQSVVTQMH